MVPWAHMNQPQTVSRSVQPLLHTPQQRLQMKWDRQPPKIAPSHRGSEPPSSTWFLGPILVRADERDKQTRMQTHRHTCRPRYSVCRRSPHLIQCMPSKTEASNQTHRNRCLLRPCPLQQTEALHLDHCHKPSITTQTRTHTRTKVTAEFHTSMVSK